MVPDEKAEDEPIYSSASGGKFYEGHVFKLFRGSRSGIIRSRTGREITFVFEHVQMLGTMRQFEDLREGMTVEYDVSWTSNGLRISLMRLPD